VEPHTGGVPDSAQNVRRYLDGGSSEPLDPVAREALLAAYDAGQGAGYADPLRLHSPARQSRLLLDNARAAVAEALGVRPDEVTFTHSGTAAVHLGVLGLLRGRARVSKTLAVSAVEHSAVFAAARWWEEYGGAATQVLPVDRTGRLLQALDLDAEPAVVALQQANPEVGTVQPVQEVAAAMPGVPVFVDACATAGLLPLPAGWSAAALSAHKWGGPAGVGVLLVRKGARWRPPFPTDDRVDPRTSGFENVPAALAAAAALQGRVAAREALARRHEELAVRLRAALVGIPDVELHGHPDERLPYLVSFSCLYVDGEALVTELDRRGFAVASGSACTASALEPSHVLVAMGALTHGNARVTFTPTTTTEDVDALAAALPEVVDELRRRVDR
jgi:cysteine desulfurase